MLANLAHAVIPLAVIVAAVVLGALRVIDPAAAVGLISGAGGVGTGAVGVAAVTGRKGS